ncbi:hypothetical protein BU24DRAFT_439879 [Aaosphaeria arxii CBS 175.79]|uniref:Uncharacterized protein n=1 Tax=Aaosphaeria arxii CBS 175.79 TaxID=1450172 RepID=A0A6A5Y3X2_9PLEO|nr:uncharacterized protein BU24DRAFT_439879 [Aaosphaeria arxii CBS 175.79]KAF2019979.1 hypothetical protein BU24DRAFT_439879 [Aaosphaeria arxii CBS 175.79]
MRRGHLWRHKSTHVFRLLGGGRLWSSLLLPFLASMCIALLALSLRDPEPTFYSSWGTSSQLLLQFTRSSFTTKGIIFTAWFANTPQVLLSIAYFSINRLCTSICSVIEWNNFGLHRKGLRVSSPSHLQRKTHFLQIPWRWSLPLTCTSGFLHWLLSQTLFLVRFEKRRVDGSLYPDESKCACGYSPLSFLIFTLCFLGLLLVLLWIVLRRVTAWMPPAGHSSLVISAACRPPDEDMYAHWGKVKWGLVVKGVGCEEEKVWCSFTSGSVRLPLGVDDD